MLLFSFAGACARAAGLSPASKVISPDRLLEHTRVLASDEFEGRAPGTRGEELTVGYLVEQFQKLGLKPGNPDGTYIQAVPLVGLTAKSQASVRTPEKVLELQTRSEYVAWSKRFLPEVQVTDSEMVFVGYGVVAPEYGWDDYKGVAVKGKTLVMLVGDPPVPDPKDPAKLDAQMFKGKAMTYYGRWTYKFEIAARLGAAAALIVHETGPAGYPWSVVVDSNGREHFDLKSPDRNLSRAAVEGWVTMQTASRLMAATGRDYAALKRAAAQRDFTPVPLGSRFNCEVKTALREIDSRNVVARIEGSDAKLKNEYVIYSSHWDHLGKDPTLPGDQVYNGALDNATGTAGLLELARAFRTLKTPPRRSLLFLAVTGEEKGLLGARFYASNPLHPLRRTAADLNMDGLNVWGRTRDLSIIGEGNSTLEDLLREAAKTQGRVLTPDPESEKGSFYRSDHFEFAKAGIPALYFDSGFDYIGRPAGYGREKMDAFTAHDYHKVTDEVKPDWDLSGAIEDLRLIFEVGLRVANTGRTPTWLPTSEFKPARDATLRGAASP